MVHISGRLPPFLGVTLLGLSQREKRPSTATSSADEDDMLPEWLKSYLWHPDKFCCAVSDQKIGLRIMIASRFLIWVSMLALGLASSPHSNRKVMPGQPHVHDFENDSVIDVKVINNEWDPSKTKAENKRWSEDKVHTIRSIDLSRPFAYYSYTVGLVMFLAFSDLVLAQAVSRDISKSMRCWTKASSLFVLARFGVFVFFVLKFKRQLGALMPPIYFYSAVEALLAVYHVHNLRYVMAYVKALEEQQGTTVTNQTTVQEPPRPPQPPPSQGGAAAAYYNDPPPPYDEAAGGGGGGAGYGVPSAAVAGKTYV